MSMTNDVTSAIQVLRGCIVRSIGIGERARSEVSDLNLDLEILVGGDIVVIFRVDQYTGNHVGLGRNVSHHNTIAGAPDLLKTVGQFLARTEVDEVGVIRFGGCLIFRGVRSAIRGGACLDSIRVEGGSGSLTASVITVVALVLVTLILVGLILVGLVLVGRVLGSRILGSRVLVVLPIILPIILPVAETAVAETAPSATIAESIAAILSASECPAVHNTVKWAVDSRSFDDSREAEKPEEDALGLHGCESVVDEME